jgi:PAS domain S-box-containing protein
MGFNLAEVHQRHRDGVIREWVRLLNSEVSENYSQRPSAELTVTITEAFDAYYHVLVHNDFRYIGHFIEKITDLRLEAGFSLSDVQKAFELYRRIILPLLGKEAALPEFQEAISKVNNCLSYTIHRFSDLFQKMHEKRILDHNRRLEEEVKIRTAELRESELKYKTLVEEINDGYFMVQEERIVFANKAFCHMHGYDRREVIGKKFHLFVAAGSRGKVSEMYRQSLRERTAPQTFEYMRLTKDARSFPTEITAKITRYDNRPSNIGICRDLTERVKMEQKVRETERMAYIGEITTSLSHEIRNPLSAVTLNLQILRKNPNLRGNDQRRMDIAIHGVTRLERILKELLDFAKPLQVTFAPVDINQILSSCVDLLEMKFEEKNLSILSSLDHAILPIKGDGGKLEQGIMNLLLNALEASEEGGKISVQSRYGHVNGSRQVEVTVEDNGVGIPQEQIEAIFKPFVTTKSKGTGLGLTMVKRIVEAHGGRVRVKNLASGGTSFEICLPV